MMLRADRVGRVYDKIARVIAVRRLGLMRIRLSRIFFSMAATQAFADGCTSIDGDNKSGDTVQWTFEHDAGGPKTPRKLCQSPWEC